MVNTSVRLYLARHGETPDNVSHIMQGQTQGMLNSRGREQAMALAERLLGEGIGAIVASDLRRAVETAEIVAGVLGLTIETTPLLRERDWGGFTGMYIPDLKDAAWPDDIETTEEIKRRAGEFLRFVASRYGGTTVLAVGHGIINKAIQSVYYGKPMSQVAPMANAEFRVLVL